MAHNIRPTDYDESRKFNHSRINDDTSKILIEEPD